MIGTRLAHYEITGHLGTGGMGEVYRALDAKLGRSVAIKRLPQAFSNDADRAARFEREARVLASLNHPNIAAIYGLEESGGTRFLVMELVEGDTLADRLQRGAIPVEECLRIGLQIARALESAHEKGVIHRDIKPANIKVTPDGNVKVLDFGLAKAFASADQSAQDLNLSNSPTMTAVSFTATQQGIIMGTVGYMSPEQASGQTADKRADVWAFGVVFFEMLTGQRMFTGKTVSHVLANILKADPDWKTLPANLHPRLRLMLERCLEKEPEDRYHDIADARVDIERVMSDPRGPLVQPESAVAAQQRQSSSRWPWIVAVAVAVIAGAIGWFMHRTPVPKADVVRFPMFLPSGTSIGSMAMAIGISPDGTKIAYELNGQIYLRYLNETEGRPVPGTKEGGTAVVSPVFSPDGQWLAYVHVVAAGGPYFLKRVPITGGTPVKIFEGAAGPAFNFEFGLSWPATDSMIFANRDGIVRIPSNGGTPDVLVKGVADETIESPQLLPGGKQVLFVRIPQPPGTGSLAKWDAAEIAIQSIHGNDRTVVWKGGSHARYVQTGHLLYAQGTTIFALPLDIGSRKVTGGPVPLLEGVQRSSNGITDVAQYVISDNGTLVAAPGGTAAASEKGLLALMDRKGVVTPLSVKPAQYRSPRFSPDGKQLAVEVISDVSATSSIWIYDLSGRSELRQLTEAGKNSQTPVWTPDSKRITFGSIRDGAWGIYEQAADGSGVAAHLTTAKMSQYHQPYAWSPDDQTLIYGDVVYDGNIDIWSYSRSDHSTKLIAGGPGNQFGASFSPDGKWLTFTDNARQFGIRVLPFPVTGTVRQVTQDGEAWPVWSGTNEMFFRMRRDLDAPPQLRSMTVSTNGEFTFKNSNTLQIPQALMYQGYRDYDVTRSGDKFVILVSETKDPKSKTPELRHIDVVLNWTEELKTRVPVTAK